METMRIQRKYLHESGDLPSVVSGLAEFAPFRDKSSNPFGMENDNGESYRIIRSSDSYTFVEYTDLLPLLYHDVELLDAAMHDGLD